MTESGVMAILSKKNFPGKISLEKIRIKPLEKIYRLVEVFGFKTYSCNFMLFKGENEAGKSYRFRTLIFDKTKN